MQSDLCKRRWGQVAESGSFPALHLKPASVSGCLQSAHRFFFPSQLSVLIPASLRKLRAVDSRICRQQRQVSNRDCSVNIRQELPDHVRPCFREVWGHKPRSMASYVLLYHGPLGPKETKITRQKILFVLKFPKSHTRMGLQHLLIKVTYIKFKVTGMISQGH